MFSGKDEVRSLPTGRQEELRREREGAQVSPGRVRKWVHRGHEQDHQQAKAPPDTWATEFNRSPSIWLFLPASVQDSGTGQVGVFGSQMLQQLRTHRRLLVTSRGPDQDTPPSQRTLSLKSHTPPPLKPEVRSHPWQLRSRNSASKGYKKAR